MQFMLSRWCSLFVGDVYWSVLSKRFFRRKKGRNPGVSPLYVFRTRGPSGHSWFRKARFAMALFSPFAMSLGVSMTGRDVFVISPEPGFLYFPTKWHAKGHNKVRAVETPTSWFQWVMEGLMISSMISSPTLGKFRGKKGFKPAFDLRFFGRTSCMFQLLFPYFLTVILSTSWNLLRLRFLFGKVAYISRCRFLLSEIA